MYDRSLGQDRSISTKRCTSDLNSILGSWVVIKRKCWKSSILQPGPLSWSKIWGKIHLEGQLKISDLSNRGIGSGCHPFRWKWWVPLDRKLGLTLPGNTHLKLRNNIQCVTDSVLWKGCWWYVKMLLALGPAWEEVPGSFYVPLIVTKSSLIASTKEDTTSYPLQVSFFIC